MRLERVEQTWRTTGSEARGAMTSARFAALNAYLSQSVFKVVLQKSILTQIRQLILYISTSKG